MGDASENRIEKRTSEHVNIGLLAHVDAGKTTLAESMLYLSGNIRKLGRVDHKDAFLDTYELERARGITIFSKQAEIKIGDKEVTLLDTPGHVDFASEMERTLQVLDYAVLVISAADGVQGHVETLWRLLLKYQIPVYIFVNKMDQEGANRQKLMKELKKRLDDRCVDFNYSWEDETFQENLAMCEDMLLEQYLGGKEIHKSDVMPRIKKRKLFPCFFGAALKLQGVEDFLESLETFICHIQYPETFGAKVYKIARDEKGTRLTHLKVTGGSLQVKMPLSNQEGEKESWSEKVDQIRIYSGNSYQVVQEVKAGAVCAVTGLTQTYAGEALGAEQSGRGPMLEPVLTYQILLPPKCDVYQMFLKLRQLEEEDPQIHLVWKEQLGEIHIKLMGEVQKEILQSVIRERFDTEVSFGASNVVYKETIAEPIEGVGHFEPLRHYAEVHLLLEPLQKGSGLVFATTCSEEVLERNWQRLVLTHLEEKHHIGVLTGGEITDVKITLLVGRAHQKHTEGGDFRQATYRAVRQGLKRAKSILLEPIYRFHMEVPSEFVGRVLTDIKRMHGKFEPPEVEGEYSIVIGTAPVVTMQGYQAELTAYTKGRGRLSCTLSGYEPCHNEEEVIAQIGYESEHDVEEPTGSVFCAQGAGFTVPWDQVEAYMYLAYQWKPEIIAKSTTRSTEAIYTEPAYYDEKELQDIFERTYGKIERKKSGWEKAPRKVEAGTAPNRIKNTKKSQAEYLLVDGYNIIFAWEELKEIAKVSIDGARDRLLDIMCNYQGYKQCKVIVVFDAYKVVGNEGSIYKYNNIHVVFTKEAETADQYIEKTVHEIGRKYDVTVATSDALEQMIILGQGAARLSARDLEEEVALISQEIQEQYIKKSEDKKQTLFGELPEEIADLMEDIRVGKKSFGE